MRSFVFPVTISLAGLASAIIDGTIDPRDVYDEVEHIITESTGFNADGFLDAVTPCGGYVGFADNITIRGEQTAAQWIRLAFHDFVTANVSAGTGGTDASVQWEFARDENTGLFINDSLTFFNPTVSAYLSMADNIAIGVALTVGSCTSGAQSIDVRAGRVDAPEPGPSGVPDPTTSLEDTLERMATAGLSQSESIALTACGHTLGGVHYVNFPEIVDESVVTDTNLDGSDSFDTTPDVFDNTVMTQYLDGTGSAGGPLVTTHNITSRSDLRLYSSDNNATIKKLTDAEIFQSTCRSLFQRMIDTVPNSVNLSDPITPLTWKAVNVVQDIDDEGRVYVSGYIRHLYDPEASTPPPDTAIQFWTSTEDSRSRRLQTSNATTESGAGLHGNSTYWPFNSSALEPGTTSLGFLDVTYPVEDRIFVVPARSSYNRTTSELSVTAAALASLNAGEAVRAVVYAQYAVGSTVARQLETLTVPMSEVGAAGNYTLYSATLDNAFPNNAVVKIVKGDASSRTIKSRLFVH